jgi:hypothetical protein
MNSIGVACAYILEREARGWKDIARAWARNEEPGQYERELRRCSSACMQGQIRKFHDCFSHVDRSLITAPENLRPKLRNGGSIVQRVFSFSSIAFSFRFSLWFFSDLVISLYQGAFRPLVYIGFYLKRVVLKRFEWCWKREKSCMPIVV